MGKTEKQFGSQDSLYFMNSILILSQKLQTAQEFEKCILGFGSIWGIEIKIANTIEDALSYTNSAVQSRLPFMLFLIDQAFGPGEDGLWIMKELLTISPNTDVVIVNGIDDSNKRIRAYEAGARRYLSKTSELREIALVLKDMVYVQIRKKELESKSIIAAQTSWAAELAHEINHEIYKIQSAAYLIKSSAMKDSDIFINAEVILESSQNLANVGQYRDQAPTIFEVDTEIRNIVGGLCDKKNIIPFYFLDAASIQINVNKLGFRYILKQFVENASYAMKKKDEKKINVSTKAINKERLEIRFRDSGPGISEDLRRFIFQWPITTKERGGYGLLLVRQVVEDMKGEIFLEPFKHYCGAEFVINLPIMAVDKNYNKHI